MLAGLAAAGKVRHIGVSNFDVEQLRRVQAIAPVVSLQPLCSMLMRQVENQVLPYCGRQRIGVIGAARLRLRHEDMARIAALLPPSVEMMRPA